MHDAGDGQGMIAKLADLGLTRLQIHSVLAEAEYDEDKVEDGDEQIDGVDTVAASAVGEMIQAATRGADGADGASASQPGGSDEALLAGLGVHSCLHNEFLDGAGSRARHG